MSHHEIHNDDEPIVLKPITDEDDEADIQLEGGTTEVRWNSAQQAPLEESPFKISLEFRGVGEGEFDDSRLGVDLVTILDISANMRGFKLAKMKLALKFLLYKLCPMDRLSVVTFSSNTDKLCPLRQVTDDSKTEITHQVDDLVADGSSTKMDAALKLALKILNDRTETNRRSAAIMLISTGIQDGMNDAASVMLDEVPVYTFGFGSDCEPEVLRVIAMNSKGGIFTSVPDLETFDVAFSASLAGLLGVSIEDLSLTMIPINGTKISEVYAQHYQQVLGRDFHTRFFEEPGFDECTPEENLFDTCVTIIFGSLYNRETRKVHVKLVLPEVYKRSGVESYSFICRYRVVGKDVFDCDERSANITRTPPRPGNAFEKNEQQDFNEEVNELPEGSQLMISESYADRIRQLYESYVKPAGEEDVEDNEKHDDQDKNYNIVADESLREAVKAIELLKASHESHSATALPYGIAGGYLTPRMVEKNKRPQADEDKIAMGPLTPPAQQGANQNQSNTMGGARTSKIPGELLASNNYESWIAIMNRKNAMLTSNNYESWKAIMHVKHGVLRRMSKYHGESVNDLRKDRLLLEFIRKSCSAEMLPHIMYAEFAREAWDRLPEVAAWTDLEKEQYTKMLVIAATARKNSDDVPEVDKILTRRNYRKWKIYMKNVLLSKYLWTVVDGSDTIISGSYKTKNHHALVTIRMSCGEEIFRYIDEENDARVAWYKLERKLGAATASPVYANEVNTFIVDDELLTSSNSYENWIFCMKNYLVVQELWGFLEETTISDYVKDEKALDAIKDSCSPDMRAYILYMDCAKDAWVKLATVTTAPTRDRVAEHRKLCMKAKEAADHINQRKAEAAEIRANLGEHSEADEKVPTLRNCQMWETWEEYVDQLLESRFLGFSSYRSDPALDLIAKACILRIIKEACGREMIPYIFRLKSPGEVFNQLRKACLMKPKDEYMKYSRLLHAVQKNEFPEQILDRNGELWRGAHKFFRDFPEALTAEITEDGSTALHVAVRLGRVDFVYELLKLMNMPESEMKTHQGNTAIAVAADGNNMKIVKMLVDKNPDLLLIRNENGLHAVTIAAINGNEMIMRYLYPFTDKNRDRWELKSVASLLTSAARLNAFDIVENLSSLFPTTYALEPDNYGMTLLSVLAEKPSAFPGGNQLGYFGGWMYRLAESKRQGTVLKALHMIGVKKMLDGKKKIDHTAKILQHICSGLPNLNLEDIKKLLIYEAIQQSVIHGTIEVFEALIDSNPYLEHLKDEYGRGLFQIAIMYRQESIFHYISQMGPRNQNMDLLDNYGNNALHCAAYWDPSSKTVHGPALQIQREIQWFEEVERVVPPRFKEMKNYQKLTPRSLFSLEHNALAKEAEKWMKGMAQACIIVTALIATVMFAAPFTLPGGTDQNTGVSLTLKSRAFKVFMISDVLSLIGSCTSLLIFFSILTARYAEQDFLISLPRRLILGLFSLFFSIATMMATFTATVVIVFRGEARSRAYIWVSILACIPVVIFALLQYRLFVNLITSTCGRGIFRSKRVVVTPLVSIGYGN